MIKRYLLLFLMSSLTAFGQTPSLVKNINNVTPTSSSPLAGTEGLFSGGSFLLFNSSSGEDGSELWRTDLTAAGTYMIKNLYTEMNYSKTPSTYTAHNGFTYFIAGDYNFDLWKTDGTPGGTTFIKSFSGAGFKVYKMYSLTTGLWIMMENGSDVQIWRSDGTTAGTVLVKTFVDGSVFVSRSEFESVKYNNKVYFNMGDNTAGIEPWVSDGTTAGTFMLKNIASGSNSSIFWYGDNNNASYPKFSNFIVYNSKVLFTCKVGSAVQIWKTDGTTAGTQLFYSPVAGLVINDCSAHIAAANGYVFFIGTASSAFGTELCLTDGTAANTLYFDNTPGISGMWDPFYDERINGSNANYIFWTYDSNGNLLSANATNTNDLGVLPPYGWYDFTIGNNLFAYSANDGLLKSDGTVGGTIDINPGNQLNGASNACVHNGEVYFTSYTGPTTETLWKSNGTVGGTVMQSAINSSLLVGSSGSSLDQLTRAGNKVFFTATDGISGYELWTTDGTTGGTFMVKDINSGSGSSSPESLFDWNGTLYFSAYSSTNGRELWKSDGTAGGTVMVQDIYSGSNYSYPSNFTVYNGNLYFSAFSSSGNCELWKTDGTGGGTMQVKDFNPSASGLQVSGTGILGIFNGQLMIAATNGTNGAELWKSDGTTGGTTMIKDIYPGSNSSEISGGIVYNGLYYFAANDGSSGVELWVTDGTNNGTQLVKDINSGASYSYPSGFFLFGNKFYFTAYTNTNGRELWVSDGTAGGTNMLVDATSGTSNTPPSYITPNGSYFFFIAEGGQELWKSDGTTGGSTMIGNVCTNPCYGYSYNAAPVLHNGQLFFQSNGDVYSSDGNSINQVSALNLAPGFTTAPTAFAGTNLGLLVALDNQADGNECWLYNGSTATLLGNIAPYAMGSYAHYFFPYNNSVLMEAYSITTDFELYKIDNITVTSGLEDIGAATSTIGHVQVYPVPAGQSITIRFDAPGYLAQQLDIFDLQGRLCASKQLNAEATFNTDISELISGIYIFKITDQHGEIHTAKIIKSDN